MGVEVENDESNKKTEMEKDTPCANTKVYIVFLSLYVVMTSPLSLQSDQVMVVTSEQDWDRPVLSRIIRTIRLFK